MKIIIDIPYSIYETIKADQFITREQLAVLQNDILKGKIIIEGRPAVIIKGELIYITQGHIDALLAYEKEQAIKEVIDSMFNSMEQSLNDAIINVTGEEQ